MQTFLGIFALLDATAFKWRTLAHMLRTRFLKYGVWMCMITVAKCLACLAEVLVLFGKPFFKNARIRARIIDLLYWVMHWLDDIVDKDAPVPKGYPSALAYIERVVLFVEIRDEPRDQLERTLGYVLDLADQLHMDLTDGIRDILNSMHFDAVRLSQPEMQILSEAELKHHFHLLDIRGTIGLWLIILRERFDAFPVLAVLGEAVRIYYNVRDLREDTLAQLCNIPREAFSTFSIPEPRDFSESGVTAWCELPQVQAWCAAEGRRKMELYNSYMARKPGLGLHGFTNRILKSLFEGDAKYDLQSQSV